MDLDQPTHLSLQPGKCYVWCAPHSCQCDLLETFIVWFGPEHVNNSWLNWLEVLAKASLAHEDDEVSDLRSFNSEKMSLGSGGAVALGFFMMRLVSRTLVSTTTTERYPVALPPAPQF